MGRVSKNHFFYVLHTTFFRIRQEIQIRNRLEMKKSFSNEPFLNDFHFECEKSLLRTPCVKVINFSFRKMAKSRQLTGKLEKILYGTHAKNLF